MRAFIILMLLAVYAALYAVELPLEAEDFTLQKGWKVSDGGYFPAQPNLWSRTKIIADETDRPASAVKTVEIPATKTYNLWVRFESSYGFGARFKVKIVQDGKVMLDAAFGGKDEKKYFPFGRGHRVQGPWDWHNTDYVYQGATATLEKGPAKITIYKDKNEQPPARRVLDLLYLTDDLQLVPGNDWEMTVANPPIISRFTVPLFVRCKMEEGEGALQVGASFYLLGYYRGAKNTCYIAKTGAVPAAPAREGWLQAGEAVGWQRIDVPTAMPPVLTLAPVGNGKLTLEVAAFRPDNVVKTLTLEPGAKPVDLIVGIGMTKYEAGLLGGHKALTFEEMIRKQTALANAVKAPGVPAKKILLGTPLGQPLPLYFDLARALGINAQFYGADPAIYGVNPTLAGFQTATGFMTLQNSFMSKECYEGDFTALDALYKKMAADQKTALGRDLPVNIKLIEEAGPPPIDTLLTYPGVKARFEQFLAEQGLTLERAKANKAQWHYLTNYFRCLLFARTSAEATKLVEKYFPAGTRTNSGSFYPTTGLYPALARGDDPFTLFTERGVTQFCSEMTWGLGSSPDYIGPQSESYQGTLGRALAKYYNVPMGTYVISDGNRGYTGDYVEWASYALLSHGFSWLSYYLLGYPAECSFLGYPDIHAAIKRVSYAVGSVEDDLLSAKMRPARVALGYSLTTDIWDLADPGKIELGPGNTVYPQERHLLYLLLRHLQYPVDILSEDDIANGGLNGYQAYVLVGDHLRPEAAAALKAWVANGGTLIAVAGGGLYDHYHQPLATLNEVFGIKGAKLQKTMPTLRPKLELLHTAPLDTITFTTGKTMDAFAYRQQFTVGEGTAIGTYQNGEAAAVSHAYGNGKAVIIGTLPGAAYLKPAIPMRPFGRGGEDELSQFFPTKYAAGVADIIGGAVGNLPRPVICADRLVEANVLAAPDRYVIPLVNYANAPVRSLKVRLNTAELGNLTDVRASFGRIINLKRDDTGIDLEIPRLEKWEVLVVSRK